MHRSVKRVRTPSPKYRSNRLSRNSPKFSVALYGSLQALHDSFQGDIVQHPQRRSEAGCTDPPTPTAAAAPAPGLGTKQYQNPIPTAPPLNTTRRFLTLHPRAGRQRPASRGVDYDPDPDGERVEVEGLVESGSKSKGTSERWGKG